MNSLKHPLAQYLLARLALDPLSLAVSQQLEGALSEDALGEAEKFLQERADYIKERISAYGDELRSSIENSAKLDKLARALRNLFKRHSGALQPTFLLSANRMLPETYQWRMYNPPGNRIL